MALINHGVVVIPDMLGRTIVIVRVLVNCKPYFYWETTRNFDRGNPVPIIFYRQWRVNGVMYFEITY